MPIIKLDPDKAVDALEYGGWSMSLFGQPKLTIRCGHCIHQFATRDYLRLRGQERSVARCPVCSYWNVIPIVYE